MSADARAMAAPSSSISLRHYTTVTAAVTGRISGESRRQGPITPVPLPQGPVHCAYRLGVTLDPRRAQVIEMRFFGGLSVEETAESLGVSAGTVMRDWRLARAWLMRALAGRSALRS